MVKYGSVGLAVADGKCLRDIDLVRGSWDNMADMLIYHIELLSV